MPDRMTRDEVVAGDSVYRYRTDKWWWKELGEESYRVYPQTCELLNALAAERERREEAEELLENIIGEWGLNGSIERARVYFDSHKGEE